jgi:hypothetical protein
LERIRKLDKVDSVSTSLTSVIHYPHNKNIGVKITINPVIRQHTLISTRDSAATLRTSGNFTVDGKLDTHTIHVNGHFTATGLKSATVETSSYGKRKLYAMESPENWFEDFGSA